MTEHPSDPVGSVAEEAARLLGLFAGGLPDATLRAAGARAAGEPPPSHVCPECGHDPHAPTDSVCRVCPVCRVLTVVKAISPETLDRIADIVDLASDALRGLASRQRGTGRPSAGASTGRADARSEPDDGGFASDRAWPAFDDQAPVGEPDDTSEAAVEDRAQLEDLAQFDESELPPDPGWAPDPGEAEPDGRDRWVDRDRWPARGEQPEVGDSWASRAR